MESDEASLKDYPRGIEERVERSGPECRKPDPYADRRLYSKDPETIAFRLRIRPSDLESPSLEVLSAEHHSLTAIWKASPAYQSIKQLLIEDVLKQDELQISSGMCLGWAP